MISKLISLIQNNHFKIQRVFLFLITTTLIVLMFPRQTSFKFEIQKGKPWKHETLISPYDFSILKSKEDLDSQKKLIIENNKPYFEIDPTVYSIKAEEFMSSFDQKWALDKKVNKDSRFTFFNLKKKNRGTNKKERLAYLGLQKLEYVFNKGIVQLTDEIETSEPDLEILLSKENVAKVVLYSDLYTIEKAAKYISGISGLSDDEKDFLSPLLLESLTQNTYFNKLKTEKLLDQDLKNLPNSRGKVKNGQVIISQGELVTDEKYQMLLSYKKKYEGKNWRDNSSSWLFLGHLLLVFVALLIFYLFLKQFRPEIFQDNKKITFLLSMVLLMVLIASISFKISAIAVYLIPFCLLPIILKAFFDTRLSLFTHLITIIIIGFIAPNGFEFIYLQLLAGIVSILSVLQMYKRAHLFVSAAKIIAIYLVSYFAISLTQEGSVDNVNFANFAWFAANGVLTLLAYPLIFAFEKTFSLVSDISLLELSDTNNPLLRELAQNAPGTFQHSIQVANLAEEGILEIGGNALLVRAGALYHDIGKMKNPQFFIENQHSGVNPHDNLSFEESAQIIISHVNNGVIIAKENKLPDELIDFIRSHHGTSRVGYFYKQYVASFPDDQNALNKFTYNGLKPYSKETAILMMADAVEAAARSIKNPTTENIDSLVEKIINSQIDDNQFENADITLKDITKVKKLYKKKLQSIHHLRVEY